MNRWHVVFTCVLVPWFGMSLLGDGPTAMRKSVLRVVTQDGDDAPLSVDIKQARFSAAISEDVKTGKRKLAFANVDLGEAQIALDWSRSQQAEAVLFQNATSNHGDTREPRLTLRGTLEFRAQHSGDDAATKVVVSPVIVVEAANVELIHPYDIIQRPGVGVFELSTRKK